MARTESSRADGTELAVAEIRASITQRIQALTVLEVLEAQSGPMRLRNALISTGLQRLSLADALTDLPRFEADALRTPNLGRRSLGDARKAFRQALVDEFADTGWPESSAKRRFRY